MNSLVGMTSFSAANNITSNGNFIQKNIHYVSMLNKMVKDNKKTAEKEPAQRRD